MKNKNSLEYLVEAVKSDEIFGQPTYPKLYQKAGLYLFNINNNHIFHDGCKRTSLEAVLLFLHLNGFQLKEKLLKIVTSTGITLPQKGNTSEEILIELILDIAASKTDLLGCQEWIKQNMEIRPPPNDDRNDNK